METTLGMMTAMLVVASDVVFAEVGGSLIVPAVRFDKADLGRIAVARVVVSAAMRLVDDCSRVDVAV
jgi:energy-converting hydrogenase Eha subunit G